MKKKATSSLIASLCVLGLFGLILISVSSINHSDHTSGSTQSCDITNKPCVIALGQNNLKVEFFEPPQIEEQLSLRISSDRVFTIKDVSIRGINMYMGVIAVIEENSTNLEWEGWTLLGACSEPNMIWQLTIHIEVDENTITKRLTFKTFS
jgi:hypothetical protein